MIKVNILSKGHMYPFSLANISNCPVLFPLGKYAQVTNNPENDGCINAVLLVWQQLHTNNSL